MQSILPFFIDGASVIEPSPFWKYFILYDSETKDLIAFATVFESHLTFEKYRTRISQVLVLPPYQMQGLGSKLYSAIYKHYRAQDKCYQIVVEDAASDFQRIQDSVNSAQYLESNTKLSETLFKQPVQNVIRSPEVVKELQLSKAEIKKYSSELKLPEAIIKRLNDILLYAALE